MAALQVLLNRGSRRFEDVSSASSSQTLQRAQYVGLIPVDLNNDGFIDLVGRKAATWSQGPAFAQYSALRARP